MNRKPKGESVTDSPVTSNTAKDLFADMQTALLKFELGAGNGKGASQ